MKGSKYSAVKPDAHGVCHYSAEDNETWQILYERQISVIQERACDEYIQGLELLGMSASTIPQLDAVNRVLQKCTGWSVIAVPALISAERFFTLLANRQFPAATFIRSREELDYLQEPDIFHELFGHCPLLTHSLYADFVERYGQLALAANEAERQKLLRLFWLTIEFGLVETNSGTRIYGGGILSSKEETIYALDSAQPKRLPFNLTDALRTPYRIDIKQPIYYVIPSFNTLYELLKVDIMGVVHQAIALGDFKPEFPLVDE